jgi:AAA15 family ATPase/GTPase
MFIKSIYIKNYRLFSLNENDYFVISDFNIPDGTNEGSGLTVLIGENGSGKTSVLEALSLPLLAYKTESFSIADFNNVNDEVKIIINANSNFEYDGVIPKTKYKGKGFMFEASIRERANKLYLSPVLVTDRKFIRADGETKPKDGSPDLRIDVINPYKGSRFNENDYLYLDRNRLFHIRSGSFNPTRFDRLMEDFNFQYIISSNKNPEDLSNLIGEKLKDKFENKFLNEAIKKFNDITNYNINLELLSNWTPFENSFFAYRTNNKIQVNISSLGSGYEMFFCLVYSCFLAKQSGKDLIILIDEPELHMHPKLQKSLVDFLLEESKNFQIILSTQSPLFVKNVMVNKIVKVLILKREGLSAPRINAIEEKVLPYLSADEVNYIAFGLPTVEYHNELYGHLHFTYGFQKGIKDFDNDFFIGQHGESKSYPWKGIQNEVSLHTFIRNQIHHPEDNQSVDSNNLKQSIDGMRKILLKLKHAKP